MIHDPCLMSPPLQKMLRESPPYFNCYRAASDPFDLSTQLLFSQAILVRGYNQRLHRVTTASQQKCTITQYFMLERKNPRYLM